jgi:predicted phosphodiesterase
MSMKSIGSFVLLAGLCSLAVPLADAHAKTFAQWVQLGPDGTSSVRAVTDEACPSVMFDGTAVPMKVRSEPNQAFGNVTPAQFPVRGCEVVVPAGTRIATLDGKPLPVPVNEPRRIVIFGDTGCTLAASQNCNDPAAWSFPKISAIAAAAHPDLVIHVGDYNYRHTACPVVQGGCAGSPWGNGWDTWMADFFEPAAPLLAVAPWIMVRGNHEDCDRAGEGWFRFLDRAPMEPICRDLSGIFVARVNNFGVIVVDGAAADPKGDPSQMAVVLRHQFDEVLNQVPPEAWIAMHRPLNAMRLSGSNQNVVENIVQELALGPDMPPSVRMSVAGHIHFFQAVDFGGTRPPQLVVGTGGANLATMTPISMVGADINGRKVVSSETRLGFGYMIWDRAGTEWLGTLYDVNGNEIDRCHLIDRTLKCGS